jgi:hypothetical protein
MLVYQDFISNNGILSGVACQSSFYLIGHADRICPDSADRLAEIRTIYQQCPPHHPLASKVKKISLSKIAGIFFSASSG